MPLPAAALVAMLLGGGFAAKGLSSKMASDRLHKRNLEYLDRFDAIEQGKGPKPGGNVVFCASGGGLAMAATAGRSWPRTLSRIEPTAPMASSQVQGVNSPERRARGSKRRSSPCRVLYESRPWSQIQDLFSSGFRRGTKR